MPHKDPEARREYHRNYKKQNRWRYAGRQKTYDAAKHANERAEQYGRPGTLTPEDVEKILATGECFWCGSKSTGLTVDHVIGLHDERSTNTPENCVAACGRCNKQKKRKERPDSWSVHGDKCRSCGRSDIPHSGLGLCRVCNRVTKGYDLTEGQFQRQVVDLAAALGWWTYHTHDSRGSNAGFPDLVLVKPPRVLFVELKSRRGRVSLEQQQVLGLLQDCSSVETYLWRPSDWPVVEAILRGRLAGTPTQRFAVVATRDDLPGVS